VGGRLVPRRLRSSTWLWRVVTKPTDLDLLIVLYTGGLIVEIARFKQLIEMLG